MIGKKLMLAMILLTTVLTVRAFAIDITASVDRQDVGLGDPVTLKITIVGKGGTLPVPSLPDLSSFEVYSSGRSQNISIINGAFSSTLDQTYVLVPKKAGVLIIGPVVVRDKDGMAATEPIKIVVRQQSNVSPSQQPGKPAKKNQPPQTGGDFFIDQIVDKTSPYVGEQVTLTFRFYQAVNLWDQPALEWPKYVGFTVEDLPPNSRYYDVFNGKRYLVTEIKRALFPLSAGKLTIDTPQLTIKPDDFGSAFDPFSFFDRDLRDLFKRGQPKVLMADAIRLNVKPLPESGRPVDFTGAVGKFYIKVETDKDSVGVDEPITLKVLLTGTGNIRSLPDVKLPELADFRIYDSGNTESVSNANQIISGTKTFEQAIIPKTSGRFTIPSIGLSYFDPVSMAYRIIKTDPITIIASGAGLVDVGGAPKNIISTGKQSFGYIITEFPRPDSHIDLFSSFWFWFLQGLPLAAVGAALAYRSRSRRLQADRGFARKVGASKRLKALFREASAYREKGDFGGFYGALYDAIIGFVADRLNLEKSGLTIEAIQANGQMPGEIRQELTAFLEQCQSARFAPRGLKKNHADQMLGRATGIVSRLIKVI
jgi:hypothetical protein